MIKFTIICFIIVIVFATAMYFKPEWFDNKF